MNIEKPNHPLINEIDNICSEINSLEKRINELNNELKNIKLEQYASNLNMEQKINITKYLYWNIKKISFESIHQVFFPKYHTVEVHKLLSASKDDIICSKCGEYILFTSRAQVIKKDYIYDGKYMCKSCWNDEYEMRCVKREIEEENNRKLHYDRIENLKKLPYKKYLQTKHWHDRRNYHLKQSNFRCQVCNKNGILSVHHRTYVNRGCEPKEDLITLCQDCHSIFHQQGKLAAY